MKKTRLFAGLLAALLLVSSTVPVMADETAAAVSATGEVVTKYEEGKGFTWTKRTPLPGVSFEVISDDGVEDTIVTGEDGKAEKTGLSVDKTYSLSVKEYDKKFGTPDPSRKEALPNGNPTPFDFVPEKVTIKANTPDAPGTQVALFAANDITDYKGNVIVEKGTKLAEKTSNESMQVIFENLPGAAYCKAEKEEGDKELADMYELKVTKLAKGRTDEGLESAFVKGDKPEHEVSLVQGYHKVKIHYIDQNEKQAEGAVLALTKGEQEITRFTTGASAFEADKDLALEEGTYTVKVISHSPGFMAGDTSAELIVKTEDYVSETTIHAKKSAVKIIVKDSASDDSIPGAALTVKGPGGFKENIVTGPEGYTLEGVIDGEYTVEETKAATGYIIAAKTSFVVKDGKAEDVIIKNNRVQGYIQVQLLHATTKAPVKDATFEILDENGAVLESIKTDADGVANSTPRDIAIYTKGSMGKTIAYKLRQTKAPEGYVIHDKTYDVTLEYLDDRTATVYERFTIPQRKNGESNRRTVVVGGNSSAGTSARRGTTVTGGSSRGTGAGSASSGKVVAPVNTGDDTTSPAIYLVGAGVLIAIATFFLYRGKKTKTKAPADTDSMEDKDPEAE